MSGFEIGDRVNARLKYVRIVEPAVRRPEADGGDVDWVSGAWTTPGGRDCHLLLPASTLTLVQPLDWPPRSGDVWEDRDGGVWFFYEDIGLGLNLRNQKGEFVDSRGPSEPARWLLLTHPSIRLAYRREQ